MTTTVRRPPRWLLRRISDDAPARLFCLPYSGVGASMYHLWPERIGRTEICRVQLPGRESRLREPHYGDYESLAEQLAEALLPHLDRPFAFFGHCGGALPGFATARYLAQNCLPTPGALLVSSQVAPHHGPFGRFLGMSDAELSVELAGLIVAMGGQPRPELIEMNLGVLRADVDANRAYRLAEPERLPCAIRAISWTGDTEIRPEQMPGWSAYTDPERFTAVTLPGDHYAFLGAPAPLQAEIEAAMEEMLTPVRS
ncbi:thioesterase II family protein [Peterkaempfera sp. SMS 1(5)a]|uniref:thioesterase II family protein n=1 Tax=Peterkaempfera podocarpi TaxID=3232308 RepID=UPI003670F876